MQAARRIRTGVILVGIAYLMGIDIIFYYTTTIFQIYIGLAPLTASGLAGACTTNLVITNFTGSVFMEKLGKHTAMLTAFSHRHRRHQRWVEDMDLAPRLQRHYCAIQYVQPCILCYPNSPELACYVHKFFLLICS